MTVEILGIVFGAGLFAVGLIGALIRRNAIVILMSIELILNGANLTFVTLGRIHGQLSGELMALFVITVAAAEAAVGLAIIIAIFRRHPSVNVDEFHLLKW